MSWLYSTYPEEKKPKKKKKEKKEIACPLKSKKKNTLKLLEQYPQTQLGEERWIKIFTNLVMNNLSNILKSHVEKTGEFTSSSTWVVSKTTKIVIVAEEGPLRR